MDSSRGEAVDDKCKGEVKGWDGCVCDERGARQPNQRGGNDRNKISMEKDSCRVGNSREQIERDKLLPDRKGHLTDGGEKDSGDQHNRSRWKRHAEPSPVKKGLSAEPGRGDGHIRKRRLACHSRAPWQGVLGELLCS